METFHDFCKVEQFQQEKFTLTQGIIFGELCVFLTSGKIPWDLIQVLSIIAERSRGLLLKKLGHL